MIIKTLEATYSNGALQLLEPLDIAPRSRVRVRVEIPESTDPPELRARIDAAYADGPDEDERRMQREMLRLRGEQADAW